MVLGVAGDKGDMISGDKKQKRGTHGMNHGVGDGRGKEEMTRVL